MDDFNVFFELTNFLIFIRKHYLYLSIPDEKIFDQQDDHVTIDDRAIIHIEGTG